MSDQRLTHQLNALDDACIRLQSMVADDKKALGILKSMRSLLIKLVLDRDLKPVDRPENAQFGEQPLAPEIQHLREFEAAFQRRSVADAHTAAHSVNANSSKLLTGYLAQQVFCAPSLVVDSIEVIAGGYSKLTLRARLANAVGIPNTLILRVDRLENQKFIGTRVADEYPLLTALHQSGVTVPKPYALEHQGTILGAPFIVLAEAAGTTVGDLFDFPAPSRELGRQLARQLALIHAMPESIIGSRQSGTHPVPEDVIRREIDRFRDGWSVSQRSSGIIDAAFRCIRENLQLASGQNVFIHGDFGLHNILIDQGRITAVLDWEFARLGCAAVDLGWVYFTAEHLVGWETFLADYAEAGGIVPPRRQIDFYRLWGSLRFALLCCQVDDGFNAGQLPEIEYAVPGNCYLRIQLMRVAAALDYFGEDK